MRSIVILALTGLALAAYDREYRDETDYDQIYSAIHPYDIQDTSFRSGREYKYYYDGQIMTGIPGTSKQHSATRIQALIVLQYHSTSKTIMKMTHLRMGRLNRHVPNPRAELPFGVFEQTEIQPRLRQQLQKPVQFKWEQGEVTDLVYDGQDEPWSVNIKRGVLNMLQLRLRNQGEPDLVSNQIEPGSLKATHYRTTEKTLEGECEVIYNIESLPNRRYSTGRPVLNITKSINFERCQQRPEVKYNWRFHQLCPSCDPKFQEDEKSLKSATIVKYNITGDRDQFLIESVKVESHYMLVPFNEEANVIATYVNQTLVLYKTSQIQSQVEELQNPRESQSDLTYSLQWDQLKEKFHMEGEHEQFYKRNPYSEIPNKVEFVADILKTLVTDMEDGEVSTVAPRQLDRLVIIMRMLKYQEIEQIHEQFYKGQSSQLSQEHKKKAKDILPNVLALCGTKDCLTHLIKKIESNELPLHRAASALRQLHQTRVVSTKMVNEMKRLCESSRVEQSFFLKQACYLSLGSMVYTACGQRKDLIALDTNFGTPTQTPISRSQCPETVKHEIVNWMWQKFHQASTVEERILMLKMIGNSGLDLHINKLEQVINDKLAKQYHPKTRTVAIAATRLIIEQLPKKVQRVLVPVMLNKFEHPEVRMIAAYYVMQTMPDRFLLSMIAKELNSEPSYHYRTFLYTYMNDLANSTNPCYKEMSTHLKLALRFVHQVDYTITGSKLRNLNFYLPSYKAGLDFEPFMIMSNRSILPRFLGLNIGKTGMGFFSKWLTTVGVSTANLDQLLWKFFGPSGFMYEREDFWNQFLRRSPRDIRHQKEGQQYQRMYQDELKGIWDSLKLSKNYFQPSTDPVTYFYLRHMGQDVFYLPVKTEYIREFIEQGSFGNYIQDIASYITPGQFDVSYATILSEFKHKIPSTIGMPLTVRYKIPLVATVKGHFQPQNLNDFPRSFSVNLDVKPSVAAKIIESVEIWSPVINSGLKVEIEGKLFAPLKAQIKADIGKEDKQLKVIFDTPKETRELLVLESRPITYTRVWPKSLKVWEHPEEKTMMADEHPRVKTFDRTYFESLLGLKLHTRGRIHVTPLRRQTNAPFCPYSGPNRLIVELKPGHQVPDKIEWLLRGKFGVTATDMLTPELRFHEYNQYMDDIDENSSSESSSSESSSESESSESGANSASSSESSENQSPETSSESTEEFGQQTNGERRPMRTQRQPRHQQNVRQQKSSRFDQQWYDREYESSSLKAERQHELISILKTIGGGSEREVKVETFFKYSPTLRFFKVQGKIYVSPLPLWSTHPYSTCYKAEMIYPKQPYSLAETQDKKVYGELKVNWSPSQQCQEANNYIKAQLQAERSNNQWEEESDDYQYWDCKRSGSVGCDSYMSKAGQLKKYLLNIEFQNVPVQVKNFTNKLWRGLKHYYFWQTDVAQIKVQNPENRIKAVIRIDPYTNRYLNITVKTPKENVTMIDLPIPFRFRALNVKRSVFRQMWDDTVYGEESPECEISSERINTFDNSEFGFKLGNCWTVAAKDCSESRFAVLIKKRSRESDEKQVKIVTPYNKVVLKKKHEGIVMELNGQEKHIREPEEIVQHGHVILRIEPEGEYFYRVYLPEEDVEVLFDGDDVKIKVSPMYMGRQCGICGNMDMDPNQEYDDTSDSKEDNYPEEEYDVRRSFHRFTLKDNECSRPDNFEEMCESENCMYDRSAYPFPEEYNEDKERRQRYDMPDEYNYRTEIKPKKINRVIERLGKLCFSKKPIWTCPDYTYPKDYKTTEEVEFMCKPLNSWETDEWRHQLRNGPINEASMNSYPKEFTQTVKIPTTCRRI